MSTTPMFADFKGQVIWSADDLRPSQIIDIIKCPEYPRDKVAVKLDRDFFTQYHLRHIEIIQEQYHVPVFVDAKIIEIPSKALKIASRHLKYHPWMLNVMAGACHTNLPYNDFLHDFAKACLDAGTLSCAVTVLTSKSPVLIAEEFGLSVADKTSKPAEFYANLAQKCGLTDIVCSPQEIDTIKEFGLDINTPGVRLDGDEHDDQARVDTPHGAISSGAKRIVVGRSIYNPEKIAAGATPEAIRETVLNNIQRVLDDIEKPVA